LTVLGGYFNVLEETIESARGSTYVKCITLDLFRGMKVLSCENLGGRPHMTNPFEDESLTHRVLVNDEGQYSLWPDFREIPAGWRAVGPRGHRKECLDWIERNWTDMRPASLVRQMNADAKAKSAGT
jgi:MbtH protein